MATAKCRIIFATSLLLYRRFDSIRLLIYDFSSWSFFGRRHKSARHPLASHHPYWYIVLCHWKKRDATSIEILNATRISKQNSNNDIYHYASTPQPPRASNTSECQPISLLLIHEAMTRPDIYIVSTLPPLIETFHFDWSHNKSFFLL